MMRKAGGWWKYRDGENRVREGGGRVEKNPNSELVYTHTNTHTHTHTHTYTHSEFLGTAWPAQ